MDGLPWLRKHDRERILKKELLPDRKMSLVSLIFQMRYISLQTGKQWKDIDIQRSKAGRPEHPPLEFNVSHHDGIVVFVGYTLPIGVDIVHSSKCAYATDSGLEGLLHILHPREKEACGRDGEPGTEDYLNAVQFRWCLKEAYAKQKKTDDSWDENDHTDFIDVPSFRTLMTRPNGVAELIRVSIRGFDYPYYIELHAYGDSHFIAILTLRPPESPCSKFQMMKLHDIMVGSITA
jgi:4'-phosphopantetheinyl transferase superfamily